MQAGAGEGGPCDRRLMSGGADGGLGTPHLGGSGSTTCLSHKHLILCQSGSHVYCLRCIYDQTDETRFALHLPARESGSAIHHRPLVVRGCSFRCPDRPHAACTWHLAALAQSSSNRVTILLFNCCSKHHPEHHHRNVERALK